MILGMRVIQGELVKSHRFISYFPHIPDTTFFDFTATLF